MKLRSALLTSALALALPGFAGQDPRLDYTFAFPQSAEGCAAPVAAVAYATGQAAGTSLAPLSEEKHSVSFKNAEVQDVLEWMDKMGVSYVMPEGPWSTRKVTLNMRDQSLAAIADAIGFALGGRWERRGSIFVFRQDAFGIGVAAPGLAELNREIRTSTPRGRALVPPATSKSGKSAPPPLVVEGFVMPDVEVRAMEFDSEQAEAFRKLSTEAARKALAEAHKARVVDIAETLRRRELDSARSTIRFQQDSAGRLLESLTPQQRALQSSRGYLKLSDLSVSQRNMLGNPKGDFRISIQIDGRKVEVRSK